MWLKYPVLSLATMTVATLFAHPNAHKLTTVISSKLDAAKPVHNGSTVLTKAVKTGRVLPNILLSNVHANDDPVSKQGSMSNSGLSNPSRYMQYEGDRLYWIITPKTGFDDLAIMKQEFERHGYKMQIQSLKYDPLNTYITDLKITIIRPVVGISDFKETGLEGKPIRSYGGFNGLNKLNDVAAVGSYPFNNNLLHLPQKLIQTAREEELSVTKFINDNRMNYLIETGKEISSGYGPGSTTISDVVRILSRTDLVGRYGIKLSADSTLTILDSHLPVYINNELVTNNVLKRINVKSFNTLIISEQYSGNGQLGTVNALLFYTKEP
jgi:hypothetical protein